MPRLIANAHTIYNVLLTLIVLPFTNLYARLINWMLPTKAKKESSFTVKYIDKNLLSTPAVALKLAKQEVLRLTDVVDGMANDIIAPFLTKNGSVLKQIEQNEVKVDFYAIRLMPICLP